MGFSTNNKSSELACSITFDDEFHKHFADDFYDEHQFNDENSLVSSEDDALDASEDETAEDDLDSNDSCDGLVFGSDEEEVTRPPPPPCWSDQEVFDCYERQLGIPQQNRSRIREPQLFIGEVKRRCVEKCFTYYTTIDVVTVFMKAVVPIYQTLPIHKVAVLVAKWDQQGSPIHIQVIETRQECREQEQKNMTEGEEDQDSVYLYCFPLYVNPLENEYVSSSVQRPVLYSPRRYVCGFFYPVESREVNLQEIDKV